MDAFDKESIGLEAEPTREFNTIREISVVSLVFTPSLLTFYTGCSCCQLPLPRLNSSPAGQARAKHSIVFLLYGAETALAGSMHAEVLAGLLQKQQAIFTSKTAAMKQKLLQAVK